MAAKTGPSPLHVAIPQSTLAEICKLLESGVATLESAFRLHYRTTRSSIFRSMEVGRKATEKQEAGEELTEVEVAAIHFAAALERAMAVRQHTYTEWAFGLLREEDGTVVRDVRAESANAMKMLLLTTPELRSPYVSPEEREMQSPTPETPPPEETPTVPTEDELRTMAAARGFVLVQAPPSAYDPPTAAPANPEPT